MLPESCQRIAAAEHAVAWDRASTEILRISRKSDPTSSRGPAGTSIPPKHHHIWPQEKLVHGGRYGERPQLPVNIQISRAGRPFVLREIGIPKEIRRYPGSRTFLSRLRTQIEDA